MKKIAVLTGAGVSAESGLGTYRDFGGLWDSYDPMEVASIDGWNRNCFFFRFRHYPAIVPLLRLKTFLK